MEEALHLLRIVSLLYNIGHFFNASVKVIGYVHHPHPSKVHKQSDVIGINVGESSFTCEIFHNDPHHK